MSVAKIPLSLSVLDAARERIQWTLSSFERVCVSFSGGKDSTLMLHLTAQMARSLNRRFSVLFIDWEVQFSSTIELCLKMRAEYADVFDDFYWVSGETGPHGRCHSVGHRPQHEGSY